MTSSDLTLDLEILNSWHRNAPRWLSAIRDCAIPGRESGKDAAILNAVAMRHPQAVLDIGCGEGWLTRHVRQAFDCRAVGLDGSSELLAAARATDPEGQYDLADYDGLAAGLWPETCPRAGFDVVVFNFSLFAEDLVPILTAAASRLAHGGALIIQTLSLEILPEEMRREGEGWRTESFRGFGAGDWSPMRWYCRSVPSWVAMVKSAGLTLSQIATVRANEPLSLLLVARPMQEVSLMTRPTVTPDSPVSIGAESIESSP